MNESKEIIQVLIKRRKHLGITQNDLAEIAGVSLRSVKALESGNSNPGLQLLTKILEALGMKIEIRMKS